MDHATFRLPVKSHKTTNIHKQHLFQNIQSIYQSEFFIWASHRRTRSVTLHAVLAHTDLQRDNPLPRKPPAKGHKGDNSNWSPVPSVRLNTIIQAFKISFFTLIMDFFS